MTLDVTHTKVSAVADGADPTAVRPSDWNAPHSIAGLGDGVEAALAVAAGASGGFAKASVYHIAASGDYGVMGDGVTYDSAALQALVDMVPDGSEILVKNDSAFVMLLDDTVTFTAKRNVKITTGGDARNFGPAATFKWDGADHGTMIALDACFGCHVEGFYFRTTLGTTVDKAIDIDGYGPQISSANTIRYNAFDFANQTNPDGKIVSISATALNNNENMDVSYNAFFCSPTVRPAGAGCGIYVGPSANAKHNIFDGNGIACASQGMLLENGSCTISHLGGGYCEIDIKVTSASEPTYIRQIDTEGSKQSVEFQPQTGFLILDGCRFSNQDQTNTGGFLKLDGNVTLRGCMFESRPPGGGTLFEDIGSGNLALTVDCKYAASTTRAERGIDSIIIAGTLDNRRVITSNEWGVAGAQTAFEIFNGTDGDGEIASALMTSLKLKPLTYSQLTIGGAVPVPPSGGNLAYITDAVTNVFGAAVTQGGGTNHVLLWYNGDKWTVAGRATRLAPRTITAATDSPTAGDDILVCDGAGTITITLPAAADNVGHTIRFKTVTANAVNSAGNIFLQDGTVGTTICAATAGKWADVTAIGGSWHIMASG